MSDAHVGPSPQNVNLKQQLAELQAQPIFEKCLTQADASPQGRIVIPRVRHFHHGLHNPRAAGARTRIAECCSPAGASAGAAGL